MEQTGILLPLSLFLLFLNHLSSTSDMLSYFTITALCAAFTDFPRTTCPYTSKCFPLQNTDCPKALQLVCSMDQLSLHTKCRYPVISSNIYFKEHPLQYAAQIEDLLNYLHNYLYACFYSQGNIPLTLPLSSYPIVSTLPRWCIFQPGP